MTPSASEGQGRRQTVGVKLTTTAQTTVYTVPANHRAIGVGINFCNVDGTSAVDITLEWTDSSAAVTYKLMATYALAADTDREKDLLGMRMDAGDTLKVTAGAGNDLEVVVTVLEFGRPT